jgi:hypothetical protein
MQGSWTLTGAANSQPTGITIDPANVSDIWIVDNGTDRVYQYSGAASRTSGSQVAAASFALAAGNTNPQGIADPPTGTSAKAAAPAAGQGLRRDVAMIPPAERSVTGPRRLVLRDRVTATTHAAYFAQIGIAERATEPNERLGKTSAFRTAPNDAEYAQCADLAFESQMTALLRG